MSNATCRSPDSEVRDWKGVVERCSGETWSPGPSDTVQLYDLALDPFETTDVREGGSAPKGTLRYLLILSENYACQVRICAVAA